MTSIESRGWRELIRCPYAEWEGGEVIGEKTASPSGNWKVLNFIARRYKNPPIYVTENGMDDEDNGMSPLQQMLDDELRVSYFKGYLAAVDQAIKDGTNVEGYFAWSLLGNFKWHLGYTKCFGLIFVDFRNGLLRQLKSSAYWFLRFLKGRKTVKKNSEIPYQGCCFPPFSRVL